MLDEEVKVCFFSSKWESSSGYTLMMMKTTTTIDIIMCVRNVTWFLVLVPSKEGSQSAAHMAVGR
jgi:hypothetical protein